MGGLAYRPDGPPALVMVALLAAIAFLLAGWRVALFTVLGLVFIISLGLWGEAMLTLSLVLATAVGAGYRHPYRDNRGQVQRIETVVMPVLDTMQTMPAFVYLVPVRSSSASAKRRPSSRRSSSPCRPPSG